jgi:hypothetical protein
MHLQFLVLLGYFFGFTRVLNIKYIQRMNKQGDRKKRHPDVSTKF